MYTHEGVDTFHLAFYYSLSVWMFPSIPGPTVQPFQTNSFKKGEIQSWLLSSENFFFFFFFLTRHSATLQSSKHTACCSDWQTLRHPRLFSFGRGQNDWSPIFLHSPFSDQRRGKRGLQEVFQTHFKGDKRTRNNLAHFCLPCFKYGRACEKKQG